VTASDGFDTGAFEVRSTDPPDTIIDSGPSGISNDPTPTFTFHSTLAGSTFQCDSGGAYGFTSCTSPETTRHLADGPQTFQVRARYGGNTDPTPASRSFTVRTAEIKLVGNTLVVTAAPGSRDNFRITRSGGGSPAVISDAPAGPYTGSGVHLAPGTGCTAIDDNTASCPQGPYNRIQVASGALTDRIVDSVSLPGLLNGGTANDVITGSPAPDTITGGGGADTLRGMNGNDLLRARDLISDTAIDCDGGANPGTADRADLDLAPKDPNSIVTGCETKTRH
jgi:Ca2+-binding RTX toxin-like protein